ncbi:MAG: C-GCAxxG-C-C family protein [Candidatus Hydrogenedentota bacterium]
MTNGTNEEGSGKRVVKGSAESAAGSPCFARRRFLLTAGAGLGLSLASSAASGEENPGHAADDFQIYDESTQLELEEDPEAILEKAHELGEQHHRQHGGCARCTVRALQEALDMVPDHPGLFRAATCLDAGAAPGSELSCGCFTGAGIVIGYICGGEDFASRDLAHNLIQKLAVRYQDRWGTVLCRDAREHGDCSDLVGLSARWTAEILLEQFSDYAPS